MGTTSLPNLRVRRLSFPGENAFIVQPHRRDVTGKYTNFIAADGVDAGAINTGGVGTGGGGGVGPTDNGGIDAGGGPKNPPALPVMPTFPDFTTMSCKELLQAAQDYKTTLTAPSLVAHDPAWELAYSNAIAQVMALYESKGCSINPGGGGTGTGGGTGGTGTGGVDVTVNNNPNVPPLVTTNVPGAGSIGGGGGGSSSTGSSTKPAAAATKSHLWWWVIGLGVAGYFFMNSGKSVN